MRGTAERCLVEERMSLNIWPLGSEAVGRLPTSAASMPPSATIALRKVRILSWGKSAIGRRFEDNICRGGPPPFGGHRRRGARVAEARGLRRPVRHGVPHSGFLPWRCSWKKRTVCASWIT